MHLPFVRTFCYPLLNMFYATWRWRFTVLYKETKTKRCRYIQWASFSVYQRHRFWNGPSSSGKYPSRSSFFFSCLFFFFHLPVFELCLFFYNEYISSTGILPQEIFWLVLTVKHFVFVNLIVLMMCVDYFRVLFCFFFIWFDLFWYILPHTDSSRMICPRRSLTLACQESCTLQVKRSAQQATSGQSNGWCVYLNANYFFN